MTAESETKSDSSRQLSLYLLRPRPSTDSRWRPAIESCYGLWRSVWRDTLKELGSGDLLFSDQFTRQDRILGLFHDARAVGLVCFRWTHFEMSCSSEDSWFRCWPEEVLASLKNKYREGIVVSWVTIHPLYRRTRSPVELQSLQISSLLSEAMGMFLYESEAPIALGTTRNNRSVNKFGEHAGSEVLYPDASLHGVNVDLIAFYPQGLKLAQRIFSPQAKELWGNRITLEDDVTVQSKRTG